MPRVYYVNWFRKGADGKFLWPGYGENSRVLKWIFERCEGTASARETAIGLLPEAGDLDTTGLDLAPSVLEEILSVDREGWKAEIPSIREHFAKFGKELPSGLKEELDALEARLENA
jgi:phosphoenolpyruvate carboxykinase (GTP)